MYKIKYPLKDYQKQAISFCLDRPSALVNLDTGTGKSYCKIVLGIMLLNQKKIDHYIIVGTAKSTISISKDFEKLTNIAPYKVIDLKSFIDFFNQDKNKIALMSYEIKSKISYEKNGNIYIYPEVQELINKYRVAISFDEVHKLKNPKSKVTQCFRYLTEQMSFKYGFSGTTFMSSILDIFYLVDFFDSSVFGSYLSFVRNFIVFRRRTFGKRIVNEISEFKNLEVLAERLRVIMFSYFPDLDVRYQEYRCEMTPEIKEEYIATSLGLLDEEVDEDGEFDEDDPKMQTFSSRMVSLQYIVDRDENKKQTLLNVLKDCIGEGAILYCQYHKSLAVLRELFDSCKISYKEIHGKMTEKQCIKSMEWFTSDSKNKVLIITDAGGQSLNLQSTSTVIFYASPYSLGNLKQIIGRVVRLGSVYIEFNVKIILVEDSIDEYKYNYVTANKEVYSNLFGTHIKLPDTQASGSFNSYFLQQLRNKYMWQADKTFSRKEKKKAKAKTEDSKPSVENFWKPKGK